MRKGPLIRALQNVCIAGGNQDAAGLRQIEDQRFVQFRRQHRQPLISQPGHRIRP